MATVHATLADAFRATLDLFELGLGLKRQTLRRQAPEATEQEIDNRLAEWLRTRPGAESGDGPGHPSRAAEPR